MPAGEERQLLTGLQSYDSMFFSDCQRGPRRNFFKSTAKFAKKGLQKQKSHAIMPSVSEGRAPLPHWDVAKR